MPKSPTDTETPCKQEVQNIVSKPRVCQNKAEVNSQVIRDISQAKT